MGFGESGFGESGLNRDNGGEITRLDLYTYIVHTVHPFTALAIIHLTPQDIHSVTVVDLRLVQALSAQLVVCCTETLSAVFVRRPRSREEASHATRTIRIPINSVAVEILEARFTA